MPRPVLAVAGILFVLAAIAFVVYTVYKLVVPHRSGISADAPGTAADALPHSGAQRSAAISHASYLRDQYDALFKQANPPESAKAVTLHMGGKAFLYLCWPSGDALVFFPQFDEAAGKIPPTLRVPVADFFHMLEAYYPKSSRNIRDIKERLAALEELRSDGLVSGEEYAAKKREILVKM